MVKIDLHSHSNRSDGRESPTEVFEHAAAAGVDVLALTDHDTASGWSEAAEAAKRFGIGFIPGIEVTTRARVKREDRTHHISVHMLAYLPDPTNVALLSELNDTVKSREIRAQVMVDRVARDFPITWELVYEKLESGATIGRPAIADALIEIGAVESRTEAFERILTKNGPYYVATETTETLRAIELIRQAGGVPIIAHPFGGANNATPRGDLPRDHFEEMISAGLAGFEVYHREVPEFAREWMLELADRHDLVVTGSSDYHGVHGKPNRLGENTTDEEMLARIIELASGVEPQL